MRLSVGSATGPRHPAATQVACVASFRGPIRASRKPPPGQPEGERSAAAPHYPSLARLVPQDGMHLKKMLTSEYRGSCTACQARSVRDPIFPHDPMAQRSLFTIRSNSFYHNSLDVQPVMSIHSNVSAGLGGPPATTLPAREGAPGCGRSCRRRWRRAAGWRQCRTAPADLVSAPRWVRTRPVRAAAAESPGGAVYPADA